MYVHACIHTYKYIYTYVYTYTYVHLNMYIHTYTYIQMSAKSAKMHRLLHAMGIHFRKCKFASVLLNVNVSNDIDWIQTYIHASKYIQKKKVWKKICEQGHTQDSYIHICEYIHLSVRCTLSAAISVLSSF